MEATAFVSHVGGRLINGAATSDCKILSYCEYECIFGVAFYAVLVGMEECGLVVGYIVFNVLGALALYWLCRVPKRRNVKKEKQA